LSEPGQNADPRGELHVYEAHGTGLPPIRKYARDLLQRWPFAAEFSRSSIRAASTDTVLGRLWLILNPLLLACVYFLLVNVLAGGGANPMQRLGNICCGLFAYSFVSGSVGSGAGAVTGGGALISRMAFPRLLMPLAAVRTSLYRFFPTVPVYLLLRLFTGQPWGFEMLLCVVFLFLMVVFAAGLAAWVSALQVYFRDTASFLPYVLRIWLYLSPVLWGVDRVADSVYGKIEIIGNPLFSMLGGWNQLLQNATIPEAKFWLMGLAWATLAFLSGSLFFMAKERDFAVRI